MIKKLFKAIVVILLVMLIIGIVSSIGDSFIEPEKSSIDRRTSRISKPVSGTGVGGYSIQKRKAIFFEMVKAEDSAEKLAEKQYPADGTQILRAGKNFKLTKETPLMPEVDPQDVMAAIAKMQKLAPQTIIKSQKEVLRSNFNPWFLVQAKTPNSGRKIGWINSTALRGQGDKKVLLAMIRKQIGYSREKAKELKAEVAGKYSLTPEQLLKIGIEGATEGWPMPQ